MLNHSKDRILYLNKDEVVEICKNLDTIKIIEEVFKLHGTGNTVLPDEAYLSWTNKEKESARSLNMPCFIGGNYQISGTKIINGNISNLKRGIERASGLTLLFDSLTARIICIMEAAFISSLRTASVSILAIQLLRKKNWNKSIALIGVGTIGRAHIDLLSNLKVYEKIYVYDLDKAQIKELINNYQTLRNRIVIAKNPKEAIVNSDIVITTTTTNTAYIPYNWLRKGSLVIHVSLDDLLPEVISRADKLIVDDLNLVKSDSRRILGKMLKKGRLNEAHIHAELADVILGRKSGRENDNEIIIMNPFGMSIEDIAIAYHIYKKASDQNVGIKLKR